jgi:hypothetical protein
VSSYVTDAGLPVPSAQKPVTRRRGKQKAPKKPYTPRKKKAAAEGAAAKRPRKPYTPRKKKDVVPAGATAAAENDQTLQQVVIHALCHSLLASHFKGMFLDPSKTISSRQCMIPRGLMAFWQAYIEPYVSPGEVLER